MLESEAQIAADLLAANLGEGFIGAPDLLPKTDADKSTITLVALAGEEVVGAQLLFAGSREVILGQVPGAIRAQVAEALPAGARVADLELIAVSGLFAGRGIGTTLVRTALVWATQCGAEAIFALAWSDAQGPHAAKILERSDFTALATLDDAWYADSLEKGYRCPSCGWPCHCAAVLYARSLTAGVVLDENPPTTKVSV